MTKKQMKQSLRNAVRTAAPDVLEEILASGNDSAAIEFRGTSPPKQNMAFRVASCAVAAVFMLCVGAFYTLQPREDSLVSIDVNPGIEMSIDAADRVLECRALNDDAEKVLDGKNLKRRQLESATDEIVQSMIDYGYLQADSNDNAILISVANNNGERTQGLQEKLAVSVNTALKQNNAKAVVLQQNETLTKEVKSLAKQNKISVGKAGFVQKMAAKDSSLQTEALASLSIKELTLLADESQMDISDVVTEYTEEQQPEDNVPSLDENSSSPSSEPPAQLDEAVNSEASSSEIKDSTENSTPSSKKERPNRDNKDKNDTTDGAAVSKPESKPNSSSSSAPPPAENPDTGSKPGTPSSQPESSSPESVPPVSTLPELPVLSEPPVISKPAPLDEEKPPVKDSGTTLPGASVVPKNDSKILSGNSDGKIGTKTSPSSLLPKKQDLVLYCEYCGDTLEVCQDKCSHKNGKRFCKYCGRMQKICRNSCTQVKASEDILSEVFR